MTSPTAPSTGTEPSLGDSYKHLFCGDLRAAILTYRLARSAPDFQPEDWRTFAQVLNQLQAWCRDGLRFPTPAAPQPPAGSPSPLAIRETQRLAELCTFLDRQYQLLPSQQQSELRDALRLEFEGTDRDPPPEQLQWSEVIVAGVATASWIFLFAIGYTVHAGPFETYLASPSFYNFGSFLLFFGNLVMFIVASIPTNVLLLSVIAGVIGTSYRRCKRSNASLLRLSRSRDYLFAITSSFFVYIGLLAGLMTLTVSDTLTSETAEKQIQLAATTSICAFLVGYDRKLLGRMLRRAARFVNNQLEETETPGTSSPQPSNLAQRRRPLSPSAVSHDASRLGIDPSGSDGF